MKNHPTVFRISYTYDKLGNKSGVIYYFKVLPPQIKFIKEILEVFDLSDIDRKMLRTTLRVGDYSESDRDRLGELRRMYIEDNLEKYKTNG